MLVKPKSLRGACRSDVARPVFIVSALFHRPFPCKTSVRHSRWLRRVSAEMPQGSEHQIAEIDGTRQ